MHTVPVPAWDSRQVLPPNDDANPVGAIRSPYPVSLVDFITRFGTSSERCKILAGFLAFRQEIHAAGATSGFQWLDGSFAENVEALEGRAPKDLDCVTFLIDSDGTIGDHMPEHLGDHDQVKEVFSVDHYWLEVLQQDPVELVHQSAYWYSVWSHRRNRAWKGFVEVSLDPAGDAEAHAALKHLAGGYDRADLLGVPDKGAAQ